MKRMNSRGLANEARVETALSILQTKKRPVSIRKFIHAAPNSNLDRRGIDFLVHLDDGKQVPIQVKSSTRARRKFEKKCRRRGIMIPVVIVLGCEGIGTIIHRVLDCIKLVVNNIQRQMDKQRHYQRMRAEKAARRKKQQWCPRFQPALLAH